jgi:hypothetical protein
MKDKAIPADLVKRAQTRGHQISKVLLSYSYWFLVLVPQ